MKSLKALKYLSVAIALIIFLSALRAVSQEDLMTDNRVALPLPPGLKFESVCGDKDDLQEVEAYDGTLGVKKTYVIKHEPSTMQLQWLSEDEIENKFPNHAPGNISEKRWCTGTLITNNLVLTAGHCFDVQKEGWITPWKYDNQQNIEYITPEELATIQKANFKYQKIGKTEELRKSVEFPVIRLIEHREGPNELDFAVIELGPDKNGKLPGEYYNPANISIRQPIIDENLAIIQHPQGKPKKIEAGSLKHYDDLQIFYDNIDTFGGSSGSGVRDGTGVVIGVHTNGGCRAFANKGVPIYAIEKVSGIVNN